MNDLEYIKNGKKVIIEIKIKNKVNVKFWL